MIITKLLLQKKKYLLLFPFLVHGQILFLTGPLSKALSLNKWSSMFPYGNVALYSMRHHGIMVSLQDNQVKGQNFIHFVDLVHLVLYPLQHFDFYKHKKVNFIISYQMVTKQLLAVGRKWNKMEHINHLLIMLVSKSCREFWLGMCFHNTPELKNIFLQFLF